MKINKEKKASMLYLFSTLFNKGIAFLTVPIYTRLLTTSDYGITTTYTSWTDIFVVILSLALYMAIRTAFVDFSKNKKEFLNTIITFTLIISCILGIISVIIGKTIFNLNVIVVLCAVAQGASSAIIMDYQQYLMMDLKYVRRSIFLAMPNFLSAFLSVFVLMNMTSQEKYLGRILPMAVTHIIFGIIVLVEVYKKQKPSINKKYLEYGLKISLPLVLHGIALNILSQSDRTMITVLADSSQTGIYSLAYNFGMIATVVTTALEGIWVPWFMNKIKERKIDDINKKANDYLKLITFMMIGIILVGPEVLKFLASSEYWEGIKVIPPIVISNYFIFIYSLHVNVEHFYKKTKIITINTIIAATANILLNLAFIPKYGYIAAAYTTLISYFIALVLHARYTYKLENNIFPIKNILKPMLWVILCTISYYIFLDNSSMRWGILIIFTITMVIMNKKRIKEYIKY